MNQSVKFPGYRTEEINAPLTPTEDASKIAEERNKQFVAALYSYIFSYFWSGYVDDIEVECINVTYQYETGVFALHLQAQPNPAYTRKELEGRIESFFEDLSEIAKKHKLSKINIIRYPRTTETERLYVLGSTSIPEIMKLMEESVNYYNIRNLDNVRMRPVGTQKDNPEAIISVFRKKAKRPDEHIGSKSCGQIQFFPPRIMPDKNLAYIAYCTAATSRSTIPDSWIRVRTLYDWSQSKPVEGLGLYLNH